MNFKFPVLFVYTLFLFSGCLRIPQDEYNLNTEHKRKVIQQEKKIYAFGVDGLHVSNEFEGARLIDFYPNKDKTYTAVFEPENLSAYTPWFAFKIWSVKEQAVTINVISKTVDFHLIRILSPKVRDLLDQFRPMISFDRTNWEYMDPVDLNKKNSKYIFSLHVKADSIPRWISAQELVTSQDYQEWTNRLKELPFVTDSVIGKSVEGRPIQELDISEASKNADVVIITGRQHPSEVAGYFSLKAFVEKFTGNSTVAVAFRKKFRLIVFPLINPDGVDDGFGRCNANGINLNRDWKHFLQPETRAVKDRIEHILHGRAEKVRFFIDFHSAEKDLFYVIPTDKLLKKDFSNAKRKRREKGNALIHTWISKVQSKFPDRHFEISYQSSKEKAGATDDWMFLDNDVPALTWETGFMTDRKTIRNIADTASAELSKLLLLQEQPEITSKSDF
jgi:cytosolic carboxypeptidase protein 6